MLKLEDVGTGLFELEFGLDNEIPIKYPTLKEIPIIIGTYTFHPDVFFITVFNCGKFNAMNRN
tara:strand:+ start:42319 stop:42507 length:189 start_codon:yes stop_codon:yes gene_type:complete